MQPHWTDDELNAALLGDLSADRLQHGETCDECWSSVADLRESLAAWKLDSFRRSERPPAYWAWMKDAILLRAYTTAFQRRFLLVGASALAVVIVAAAVWVTPRRPAPTPVQVQQADPDDVLLYRVQAAMAEESPEALAPARVLTHELDNRLRPVSSKNPRGEQP